MPKKKIIHHDEPSRPYINMKTKVVFDPSDCQKKITTKSKSFPVKSGTPLVTQKKSKNCFICSSISKKTEFVDCAICRISAHIPCIIVNEPTWKFKLDMGPWLCRFCRKRYCSKCLKNDSQLKISRRCITCNDGLHTVCYKGMEKKTLQKLKKDIYVCIACLTLATTINPEEVEEEVDVEKAVVEAVKSDNEDEVESPTPSIVCLVSDKSDTDSKSDGFSSDCEKYNSYQNTNIPTITEWDKDQMFDYLSKRLPKKIINQIIKYDLNGRIIQSLTRNDIILKMGLKLGHALLLYKQVRILQCQSTLCNIFWE